METVWWKQSYEAAVKVHLTDLQQMISDMLHLFHAQPLLHVCFCRVCTCKKGLTGKFGIQLWVGQKNLFKCIWLIYEGATLSISVHVNVWVLSQLLEETESRERRQWPQWNQSSLISVMYQRRSSHVDINWFVTPEPFTGRGNFFSSFT